MKTLVAIAALIVLAGCGSSFEPGSGPGSGSSADITDAGADGSNQSADSGPPVGVAGPLDGPKGCGTECICEKTGLHGTWVCDALSNRCVCPTM